LSLVIDVPRAYEARGLDGLRVVEVAHGMAGEMVGMVLADSGAEVVKIEPPTGTRGRAQAGFGVWNRGKRSVVADLDAEAGRARLATLVAEADAFVEDLRPSTVARLGIGYEQLRLLNPSLVYLALTGFGERGPLRDLPGYEYVVAAASGRMADIPTVTGERPTFTPTPILSFGASMLGVQGLLAALHQRDRGHGGQRVHTSLAHALVTVDMTSGHGHRIHTVDNSGTVYGVMPLAFMTARCRDGAYLQMCSRFPHLFRNWMRALGLEYLYDDPAYGQMPDVLPSQAALDDLIGLVAERMGERTRDEWLAIFSAEDVGANPFLTPQQFLQSEQAVTMGNVVVVDEPDIGSRRQIGPIAHFSESPAEVTSGAPRLGADGDATSPPLAWRGKTAPASHTLAATHGSPLDDITIVECAFAYAAPFASTLLAEMGARVIKVEPPQGDPARRNWRTTYTKESAGKESVIVDLKTPEGRQIVHDLVGRADVFVHNFRPGVPDRLGVDYETLHALNPRLIYVYGSCYGSRGPWSHLPGFHSSPNAIVGTGVLEAGEGNPPQNRTFGDPAGALALAAAILIALRFRDRTGRGQYVEGTMLGSLAYAVADRSVEGADTDSATLSHDQRGFGPWCRLYETEHGWLLLCCQTPSERERLRQVIKEQAPEAGERLDAAFRLHDAGTWEKLLLDAGVPAVRADGTNLFDFMLRSPHMRANGLSIEDDIEGVGPIWRSAGSVEFSAAAPRIASPVPLGHDTDRVLAELGRSTGDIKALRRQGVTRVVGQGLS
jgi:crotonobetainyl-CoA:carnitine CoA-transferase CaiB-like acyl-CoA transferase